MSTGITISSFRTEVAEHLGDQSSQFGPNVLDDLILRSYWELQNNFKWRATELQSGDVTLPEGSEYLDYTVPYKAITGVFIYDANTQSWKKLDYVDRDEFYKRRHDAGVMDQMPTHYWQSGDPGNYANDPVLGDQLVTRLWFSPIPDEDYTLNIFFDSLLTDLSDTYTLSPLPKESHELILYGAVFRGFLRLRDFSSYERFKSVQESLLSRYVPETAKAETDWKNARVVFTPGRPYP